MEESKKTEKCSRLLVSTRGGNGPVMLEAIFERSFYIVDGKVCGLSIKIEPRIINGPYNDLKHAQDQRDYKWEVTVLRDPLKMSEEAESPTINFHNSLYMVPLAFGLGFGTFLMNEIIRDLKTYFPEAQAYLTLGIELDSTKKVRREKFYKKFGLRVGYTDEKVGKGSARIEKVEDLQVFESISGVTEIVAGDEIKTFIDKISSLEEDLKDREYVNRNLNDSVSFYQELYHKCSAKYWKLIKGGVVAILIGSLAFYVTINGGLDG